MPRHDDRYGNTTRLYVGHLSSRTRSRDLEDVFRRYGRVRDVDMKRDYAFVEFSDPRDADDARYGLNGRDVDGSRIIVEHAKGVPRGPGGSREHLGRGPTPGTGRCFNCGNEGHWARDCKAGDWKNKCYHCGERGHIEKNCQNSPKKLGRKRSYSRSPSPRHGRIRRRSYSRSPSHSRSRSPLKRERSIEHGGRSRSASPLPSKAPLKRERSIEHGGRSRSASPLPSKAKKHSPMPARNSRERVSPSLSDGREVYEYDSSPDERIGSPKEDVEQNQRPKGRSPVEENGRSHSISPRDNGSPIDDGSPRGSD